MNVQTRLPMLGLWIAATFFSCNIFETRPPEPPTQSSSSYTPATEPSLVFSNMSNAFRDLNSLNYLKSFADSSAAGRGFSFEPTPQAKVKYGGAFLFWNRQSEQQYFENLRSKIPSGSAASLVFQTLTVQSIQSDSAQYEATYTLTASHSVASVPKQATGKAQFLLLADRSRNWVIWRWIDVPTGTSSFTWSDLKGEFGQ
ncbi:MAG: hypothetical protein NTU47_05785 [Ignavibacteriales bacterium]|nr:hypothetical protein [Ignavibacteriales bacterium]